jgi:hypothetical protein
MRKYKAELLDRRTERQLDRIHEPDFGRIRDMNWRVIYTIDDADKPVTIVAVKRRREDTYRQVSPQGARPLPTVAAPDPLHSGSQNPETSTQDPEGEMGETTRNPRMKSETPGE